MQALRCATFGIQLPRLTPAPSSASTRCQAQQVGDKVLPLIRQPQDILFLGPRIALGALLSTSQNLERLPSDLERLSTLVSDPRSVEEKQQEVLLEIEDRIAAFIERGLVAENDVISAVNEVIPEDVKSQLPEEVRSAVLTPRPLPSSYSSTTSSGANDDDWTTTPTTPYASYDTKPMATWTITSMDDDSDNGPSYGTNGATSMVDISNSNSNSNSTTGSTTTVAASQAAAELVEIQSAVLFLKDQLAALQANNDPSRTSMLKLNLREASQSLSRRLEQRAVPAAGSGGDATVAAAVEEANALLSEVETLLL